MRRAGAQDLPEAPRRDGEGPARDRLDGRSAEGLDVHLGEDPRPLREGRLDRLRQAADRAREDRGRPGRRLRRLRRRPRAHRADRERASPAPGRARHQGHVQKGRLAPRGSLKPIRVGLLGIGTVGGGTWDVLNRNADEIRRRAGRAIEITQVADKATEVARKKVGKTARILSDAFEVVQAKDVDIVVELIGGYTVAKSLVLEAIKRGKHVVTANKALLATHGNEIFKAAQKKGVMVAFEASVGGGIPIIKALREGLAANRIDWIAGIINGTSNFILSEMRDKGISFDTALKDAQKRGYAETDPTFDIEGIDAAHKLTILSALAFGIPMQFKKAYTEGISKLTADDIRYAEELGYRI